jgi:copper chaperone CopZ
MKRIFIISLLMVTLSATADAGTITATVNGLVCAFCATGIEKTFKKQPAVDQIKVDLENRHVTINTKPGQDLDDTTITRLLTDSGYSVTGITRGKQ